ncbi:hypothetical protein N0V83_007517 [Neocucurbitaria cava]|uniref:RNase III domain-containing protein n=1 Tax=Neocucurbitaria cava TaxID=798079 RepID=A0A9W8Y5B6_9PLEO|nr:hypothetical protein N0V83_007517 [Neocucurbitaria cava]
MSAPKRGGSFNHYGDLSPQFNKRQRPNRPVYSSATYHNAPPYKPQLSSAEMKTGLVALLDRFVAEETTPAADKDILHHARELRRLLCARNDSNSSSKRELDEKRPDKGLKVFVPPYLERKLQAAKDLPPLPPIAEPHLHEAVFTHRSVHVSAGDPIQRHNIDLGLDYERLELLGDAYIELIASRALYNRFPHVDVPELCSWRERLVENSNLGRFSEAYGFPDRLNSRTNRDPSSKAWQKVVADMFEAYVAALVLSNPISGFQVAELWLTELWAPQLLGFREKVIENPQARDELNRLLIVKDVKLNYREEKPMTYDSGSIQRYYMGVYLTGWGYQDEWLGSGEGQNKPQACVAAASAAIKSSPVVKSVAQQKAELLEVKRKQREEDEARQQEKTVSEEVTRGNHIPSSNVQDDSGDDVASKKRKSNAEPSSPEKEKEKKKKKSKKSKKDKEGRKERKHKTSTDDDSS